jgi:protein ImuA
VQLSSRQEDFAGMPAPGDRRLVISRLREEIRRIEHRPGRRAGALACHVAAVDALLPDGGFPCGALSELTGGPASGKSAVALSLLASVGRGELAAWVDGHGELYPPAAASCGVDLERLLVVRPQPPASVEGTSTGEPAAPRGAEPAWRAALWACEALLASGAFAAVVMDVRLPAVFAGADAAARRLQSAAERGGAVGLWLAPARSAFRIGAAVRLEVSTEAGRIVARRALGATGAARAGGGGRAA